MTDTNIGDHSFAPWNRDEVRSLNEFQRAGVFHPFTCPNRGCGHMHDAELVATTAGWTCPSCQYRQAWAHAWMADGSWRRWLAQRDALLGRAGQQGAADRGDDGQEQQMQRRP